MRPEKEYRLLNGMGRVTRYGLGWIPRSGTFTSSRNSSGEIGEGRRPYYQRCYNRTLGWFPAGHGNQRLAERNCYAEMAAKAVGTGP